MNENSNEKKPRRDAFVDLLRAIAVLMVLGFHVRYLPQGDFIRHYNAFFEIFFKATWQGVDLFFVVSGYLVSGLLFREYTHTGKIDIARFLIRRGFKIYPSFYLLILMTAVYVGFWRLKQWNRILTEMVFLQGYRPRFWGHTWSLAVEEHFYLILVFAVSYLSSRGRLGLLPRLILGLVVAENVARVLVGMKMGFYLDSILHPSLLRLDTLGLGVLVAYLQHFHRERFSAWVSRSGLWLPLASAVCFAVAVSLVGNQRQPGMYVPGLSLTGLAFAGLLAWGLVRPDLELRIARSSLMRPLIRIGIASYSIYLWHGPILDGVSPFLSKEFSFSPLVSVVSYLLMSLALGFVMARLIEIPFLRLRERWKLSKQPVNEKEPAQSVMTGSVSASR